MIEVGVEISGSDLAKQLLSTIGDKLKPEIAEASNRAAAGVRTDGKRLLAKTYQLKPTDAAENIKVFRAAKGDDEPAAMGVFSSGMYPLFKFKPSPAKVMGGKTTGGVSALVAGRSVRFKHAFIARMKSGHIGVFQRQDGDPKAIEELYTLSAAQMAADKTHGEAISKKVQEGMQKRFDKRFMQQVDRLLQDQGMK